MICAKACTILQQTHTFPNFSSRTELGSVRQKVGNGNVHYEKQQKNKPAHTCTQALRQTQTHLQIRKTIPLMQSVTHNTHGDQTQQTSQHTHMHASTEQITNTNEWGKHKTISLMQSVIHKHMATNHMGEAHLRTTIMQFNFYTFPSVADASRVLRNPFCLTQSAAFNSASQPLCE